VHLKKLFNIKEQESVDICREMFYCLPAEKILA